MRYCPTPPIVPRRRRWQTILVRVCLLAGTALSGCVATNFVTERARGYDAFPPRDPEYNNPLPSTLKPNPALYLLLPLTIPLDVLALPLQIAMVEAAFPS